MASKHEEFWNSASFAFVGCSARKNFPKTSYGELKKQGKKVFAVDPSVEEIEGDRTWPDLVSLPEKVEAVVIELPKEETRDWVQKAIDAGIHNVWIHMNCDTPEAVALAREAGVNLCTGTCAVMYVTPGFSFHSIHKWINKLSGKY